MVLTGEQNNKTFKKSLDYSIEEIIPNVNVLINKVFSEYKYKNSDIHGELHCKMVALIGYNLTLKADFCDPIIVFLFSILHDSKRIVDGRDKDHGLRASQYAKSLNNKLFFLPSYKLKILEWSCIKHNIGYTSSDPTIGVCWDSDRLDLWRCDIIPESKFLSTNIAKCSKYINISKSLDPKRYYWNEIFLMYLKLIKERAFRYNT